MYVGYQSTKIGIGKNTCKSIKIKKLKAEY